MPLWKLATLLALASIPLFLLAGTEQHPNPVPASAGDEDDNIFEHELTSD